MSTLRTNNQQILLETKKFLESYLSQKNKEIERNAYLSFYISKEGRGDRDSRLRRIFREAELAIKAQLNNKEANQLIVKLKSINWKDLSNNDMSTAVFVTPDFVGHLHLPFPVVESVVVARSLHLKPILNWINREDQFYLITLSSKLCRLLKGDAFSLTEIDRLEIETSESKTIDKKEREKMISLAEERFYPFMKDDHFPIILGGVVNHHDVFTKMNRDPDLIQERIIGNLDRMSYRDLHERCLLLLEQRRSHQGQELMKKLKEEIHYGKVLTDLNKITIAAIQGKIKNLVIPEDKFIWGKLDKETGMIASTSVKNLAVPEDDVLDDLAEIVMARGGGVTMCKYREMPAGIEAFAFLRS